jgi:hypothetical protein
MRKRLLTPHVYNALFEISSLRDQLHALHEELGEDEAASFTSRLQRLELHALQLVALVEDSRSIAAH